MIQPDLTEPGSIKGNGLNLNIIFVQAIVKRLFDIQLCLYFVPFIVFVCSVLIRLPFAIYPLEWLDLTVDTIYHGIDCRDIDGNPKLR
jgi:hypothetical protein